MRISFSFFCFLYVVLASVTQSKASIYGQWSVVHNFSEGGCVTVNVSFVSQWVPDGGEGGTLWTGCASGLWHQVGNSINWQDDYGNTYTGTVSQSSGFSATGMAGVFLTGLDESGTWTAVPVDFLPDLSAHGCGIGILDPVTYEFTDMTENAASGRSYAVWGNFGEEWSGLNEWQRHYVAWYVDGQRIGEFQAEGNTVEVAVDVRYVPSAGLHTLTMRLDDRGQFEESNEQNNVYTRIFGVGVPSPPATAVLLSPIGALLGTRQPAFKWKAASGAAWYHVLLSRNGTKYSEKWTQNPFCFFPDTLSGGNYQWWVRAWNSKGGYGAWSREGAFRIPSYAPAPAIPVDPTAVVEGTHRPQFEWVEANRAAWYHIYVTRAGTGKYAEKWIQAPATIWSPDFDFRAGNFTWWVAGWNGDGYGTWSSGLNFTIPAMVPGAIPQIGPSGAQGGSNPVFRWTKDATATWYRLWVSHPNGGAWHDKWYAMTGTGEGSVTVNGHPGGNSTWWIQGWGPDGSGPWAGPMAFSTPDPAPAKPTLIAPVGSVTSPVTFQYASARATWFRIYVSRSGTKVLDKWTETATYNAGTLGSGTYSWWVAGWNAVSGKTVWSDQGTFVIP